MLIFLHYLTLLSLSLFLMFPLRFHLQLYQGLFPIKLGLFHFTKASDKPFPRATRFCPGNFAPKHLHNPSQSLAFDLARKVQTKLKHYVICKAVMSFEPVALNVNLAPVSVCQSVNVVRSVFCHPHISFLAKPLFTTVNLVGPVTVYNVKSVNSPHHIRRVFPSVHCTTSIHRKFSYRRDENVSFPLPSSSLFPSLVIKSHLSHLISKHLIFNISTRPSLSPESHLLQTFNMYLHQLKLAYFL